MRFLIVVLMWAIGFVAVAHAQSYVPFLFSGQTYCWSVTGWNGAGWYVCGDALTPGAGWGGPAGWQPWVWNPVPMPMPMPYHSYQEGHPGRR